MCIPEFNIFSLYTGELDFGQTIWHKTQVLILGNASGNTLGTLWELYENTLETREKKLNVSLSPLSKRKKLDPFMSACWAFPLDAWNFYFQNCSSPFSTWTNTPVINWAYIIILIHINYFMGVFITSSFFFVKEAYSLTHQQFFGKLSSPPQLQNKNNCIPKESTFFNLYTWQLNLGQSIWDKIEVLLRTP
jgi:hypothetical protein